MKFWQSYNALQVHYGLTQWILGSLFAIEEIKETPVTNRRDLEQLALGTNEIKDDDNDWTIRWRRRRMFLCHGNVAMYD
jgi:hypothetical protein